MLISDDEGMGAVAVLPMCLDTVMSRHIPESFVSFRYYDIITIHRSEIQLLSSINMHTKCSLCQYVLSSHCLGY